MLCIILPIAIIVAILGLIILSGKGDSLIAGYNTASRAERAKVNIRRLRLVTGITMLGIAALTALLPYCGRAVFLCLFFPLLLASLILSSTWCTNNDKSL